MASGRKIENEAAARRCLRAVERSGLSAGEWARAHGIDGRSLRAWQMNLGRRGTVRSRRGDSKAPLAKRALVELVPAAAAHVIQVPSGARYALEIAGARLEFGDDVSVATLRRVLEALRSC